MTRICLGLLLACFAMQVWAQQSVPADAPKTQKFNQTVEVKANTSCTSENGRCRTFCNNRPGGINECYADCQVRVDYCKTSGIYLWINSPSVQVSSKE
jgi:hypothetical protein